MPTHIRRHRWRHSANVSKTTSYIAAATAQHASLEPEPSLPEVEAKKSVRPPSREGKRVLSIYLPPEA